MVQLDAIGSYNMLRIQEKQPAMRMAMVAAENVGISLIIVVTGYNLIANKRGGVN